jgi:hypothetical protein
MAVSIRRSFAGNIILTLAKTNPWSRIGLSGLDSSGRSVGDDDIFGSHADMILRHVGYGDLAARRRSVEPFCLAPDFACQDSIQAVLMV